MTLTIEECVYWLTVINVLKDNDFFCDNEGPERAANMAVLRDTESLTEIAASCLSTIAGARRWAGVDDWRAEYVRIHATVRWLCRQSVSAIHQERGEL